VVEVVVPGDLEQALYRFLQVLIQLLLALAVLVVFRVQGKVKTLFSLLLFQQAVDLVLRNRHKVEVVDLVEEVVFRYSQVKVFRVKGIVVGKVVILVQHIQVAAVAAEQVPLAESEDQVFLGMEAMAFKVLFQEQTLITQEVAQHFGDQVQLATEELVAV